MDPDVPRPGNAPPTRLGPRSSPLPHDLPGVHCFAATGSDRELISSPPTKQCLGSWSNSAPSTTEHRDTE
eukprot:4293331-Pyramimonas_sp.AAC.1